MCRKSTIVCASLVFLFYVAVIEADSLISKSKIERPEKGLPRPPKDRETQTVMIAGDEIQFLPTQYEVREYPVITLGNSLPSSVISHSSIGKLAMQYGAEERGLALVAGGFAGTWECRQSGLYEIEVYLEENTVLGGRCESVFSRLFNPLAGLEAAIKDNALKAGEELLAKRAGKRVASMIAAVVSWIDRINTPFSIVSCESNVKVYKGDITALDDRVWRSASTVLIATDHQIFPLWKRIDGLTAFDRPMGRANESILPTRFFCRAGEKYVWLFEAAGRAALNGSDDHANTLYGSTTITLGKVIVRLVRTYPRGTYPTIDEWHDAFEPEASITLKVEVTDGDGAAVSNASVTYHVYSSGKRLEKTGSCVFDVSEAKYLADIVTPRSPGYYTVEVLVDASAVSLDNSSTSAVFAVKPKHEPVLSNPRVIPISGTTDQRYEFLVDYYDQDGDAPEIHKNVYISGTGPYTMTLKSGTASNGTYSYQTDDTDPTNRLPIGNHNFFFAFTDRYYGFAMTPIYAGPAVGTNESMVNIAAEVTGGPASDNVEITFEYGSFDNWAVRSIHKWNASQLPQSVWIPSGQDVMFTIFVKSPNHTFEPNGKWVFRDENQNVVRESSAAGYGFKLISGNIYATVSFTYTPQPYTISGQVRDKTGTPFTTPVTLRLSSPVQSPLPATTDASGNYSFTNLNGGVAITVTPQADGYGFSPPSHSISNLTSNLTDDDAWDFTAYSSDVFAPMTELTETPASVSEQSTVTFRWSGTDNVTPSDQLEYSHMLDGVDDDWSDWSPSTVKSYDLPNGVFSFRVKAKDAGGNENHAPTRYQFVVNAAPRISQVTRSLVSIWASRVTISMPSDATQPTNRVVLLEKQSTLSDHAMAPVQVYRVGESTPVGANAIIAERLGVASLITKEGPGHVLTLPDAISPGQTLEYDVVWGKILYFGWREFESVPLNFPNGANLWSSQYLDDQLRLWRAASKVDYRTVHTADDDGWLFVEISNKYGSVLPEHIAGFIPGDYDVIDDKYYGTSGTYHGIGFLMLENLIWGFWNEQYYTYTQDRRQVWGNAYGFRRYNSTTLTQVDNGTVSERREGFLWWRYPTLDGDGRVWLVSTRGGTHSGDEEWVVASIVNSGGSIAVQSMDIASVPAGPGDRSIHAVSPCLANGKMFFVYDKYWEIGRKVPRIGALSRSAVYAKGFNVDGTISVDEFLVSMPPSPDEQDIWEKCFVFGDKPVVDLNGKVWISFKKWVKDTTGQYTRRNYYSVIDPSGTLWKGPIEIPAERFFHICDKDGYIWANEGNEVLVLKNDDTEVLPRKTSNFMPNQHVGTRMAQVNLDGYRLYDRRANRQVTIERHPDGWLGAMQLCDLDMWGEGAHVADLAISKDGQEIWRHPGTLDVCASIDVSSELANDVSVLTFSQEDKYGGQVLVTFEYKAEPPTVAFDAMSSNGNEDVTPVNILVSLSRASDQVVTINYAVTGGTATRDVDYALADGTLTFDPGDVAKNIELLVIDDALDEWDETVEVTLSDPSNAELGSNSVHTNTIIDDDPEPSVAFNTSSSEVPESVTTGILAVSLDSASGKIIIVGYSVTDGTATLGVDYTLADGTLTFNPGETTKNIEMAVVNDTLDEWDETVELTLSNPLNAQLGSNQVHTYTIIDDDTASIAFDRSSSEGLESVTRVNLLVSLDPISSKTITVDLVTGGSAMPDVDYTPADGTLTFNPGETGKDIEIAVIDDSLDEWDETVELTLSNPSNAELGINSVHMYTIIDDDPVQCVTFNTSSSEGSEAVTPAILAVSLDAVSGKTITVDYSMTGGTATHDVDYMLADGTFTFNPGEITKNIEITLIDDTLDEWDETVEVTLSNPSNAELCSNPVHTYTIMDDDLEPEVAFNTSSSEGPESVTPAILGVSLDAVSGKTITVDYSMTGGTATPDVDYTLADGTLTFNPGETTKNIEFPVIDDTLDEWDETVEVTLSNLSNAQLGSNQVHTYTIIDDDTASIAFDRSSSEGLESVTRVNILVSLDPISSKTITVDLVTGGTAMPDVDYAPADGTLTFDPGETTKNIEFHVIDDTLDEWDETVEVTLSNPSNAELGINSVHMYTIIDDDPVQCVTFNTSSSEGSEAVTPAILAVSLDAVSGKTITVDYSMTGGTATHDVDYMLADGTLTFNPDEITKNIEITVIDDTLDEWDETVEVTLSNPSNAEMCSNPVHTYTIMDDDLEPEVAFNTSSSEASESVTTGILAVSLDGASGKIIIVGYSVTDGTATLGVDYTLADGTLTFKTGETTKNIEMAVVNDTLDEWDETVEVTLSNPLNAQLGSNQVHTYTIIDDDTASIAFDRPSSKGLESVTRVNLLVSLDPISSKTITVDLVTGGTAMPDVDYTLADGTLTFNPGETTKNIEFHVIDDTLDEWDETVEVTLSNPSNAELAINSVHTYTIMDDDPEPSVAFNMSNSEGVESVTSVNLMALLSTPSGKTVTVDYSATGGTAMGDGVDYMLDDGTLTFYPGDTTKPIPITVVDDSLAEGEETIIVTLTNQTNATLAANTVHTYTIIDLPDMEIVPAPPVDFGDVLVGSALRRTFEIKNVGEAPLNVTSVQITEVPSDFSIISPEIPPADGIDPQEKITVIIEFKPEPESVGQRKGTFQIQSDDPDENPLPLELTGKGTDQLKGFVELELSDAIGEIPKAVPEQAGYSEHTRENECSVNVNVTKIDGESPHELQLVVGFDSERLEYKDVKPESEDIVIDQVYVVGNELTFTTLAANGTVEGPLASIIFGLKPLEGGINWEEIPLNCAGSASGPAGPVKVEAQAGAVHIGPEIAQDFLALKKLSLIEGSPGKLSLRGSFNMLNDTLDLTANHLDLIPTVGGTPHDTIRLNKNPAKPRKFNTPKNQKNIKASLVFLKRGTSKCSFKISIRDDLIRDNYPDGKITHTLSFENPQSSAFLDDNYDLELPAEIEPTRWSEKGKKFKWGSNRTVWPNFLIRQGKLRLLKGRPGKFSFATLCDSKDEDFPQPVENAHIELWREDESANLKFEFSETVDLEKVPEKPWLYKYRKERGRERALKKLSLNVKTGSLKLTGSSLLELDFAALDSVTVVLGFRTGDFFERVKIRMSGDKGMFRY